MLVLILLIAMLLVTIAVMSCTFKRMDIVYLTVIALLADTVLYAVVSEILYMIKKFTIARGLFVVLAVAVVVLIALLLRKKRPDYSFSIRRNIIPVMMVLVVSAAAVAVTKSGYFGLEDSVGVIQSKAMKMNYEYYIYGLSDETYYEQVYDQAEYETMKQILAPYEERCNSGNSAVAAIMAVMARLFGVRSMNYVYAYLGALAVYMVYILAYTKKNKFNSRYGSRLFRLLVPGAAALVVSCVLIAVFSNRSTAITWDELEDMNSITGGTSAYVIDQSMLGDYYIPVKCLTLGCTIPETTTVQQDLARFYNTETLQLNQCANVNYITKEGRFTDAQINGYALSTAYTGSFVLYRNLWNYYYDGNYVKKEVFPNSTYMICMLVVLAVLTYAYGRSAYMRTGKAEIVRCGMKAIATAGILYTVIFLCYTKSIGTSAAGVFAGCSAMSTVLNLLAADLILYVTDRRAEDGRKGNLFRYQVNRASVLLLVIAVTVAVFFTIRMNGLYTLMDGRMGSLQADAVTLITGDSPVANVQLELYTANGMESLLVAWLVLAGSMMGYSRMMYAYGMIAVAVGCLVAVAASIVIRMIVRKTRKACNESVVKISAGAVCIAVVCIIMTICTVNMSRCVRLIHWDVLDVNTSNIKSTDVVVADKEVNPLLLRAIQAVQGVRILSYEEGSQGTIQNTDQSTNQSMNQSTNQSTAQAVDIQNIAARVAAVEKQAGAVGNQIYYITSQPCNILNSDFMMGNTTKEVDYNLDVYQKYSTVAKDADFCMYRIDKSIGRSEVTDR